MTYPYIFSIIYMYIYLHIPSFLSAGLRRLPLPLLGLFAEHLAQGLPHPRGPFFFSLRWDGVL